MSFRKKSIFIWDASACLSGDPAKITAVLKTAGVEAVILHWQTLTAWRLHFPVALIRALQAAGLVVYAGAAVYGDNPVWEGQQAAAIVGAFELDGFVFDAEGGFDAKADSDSNAVKLLQAYHAGCAQPCGWCWWPMYQTQDGSGTWHPKKVLWAAMAKGYGDADFGLPMAYWSWGNRSEDAVRYLNETWKQWRAITTKPLVIAGRAYIGDGGIPTPDTITAFEARARQLGAVGVTWWSMQHALDPVHLPLVWPALAKLPKFGEDQPPVVVPDPKPEPVHAGIKMKVVNFVNVRNGPGTDYDDIGDLQVGETVTALGIGGGKTGAWARIDAGKWACVVDTFGKQYLAAVS